MDEIRSLPDHVSKKLVEQIWAEADSQKDLIAALEDKCLDMEGQKVKVMEQLAKLREVAAKYNSLAGYLIELSDNEFQGITINDEIKLRDKIKEAEAALRTLIKKGETK